MSECWGWGAFKLCSEHPGFRDCETYCESCGEHFGLQCEKCEKTFDDVWDNMEPGGTERVADHAISHANTPDRRSVAGDE